MFKNDLSRFPASRSAERVSRIMDAVPLGTAANAGGTARGEFIFIKRQAIKSIPVSITGESSSVGKTYF
jgi:hypothetical protein